MNPYSRCFLLLTLILPCLGAKADFNDLGSGTLLLDFQSGDGVHWVAPVVSADVDIQVSGPIARATVTQSFRNPGSDRANATYVFPLPETAAVDHMRLIVGERIIEGKIREKQQARQVYEQAKREGRHAGLVSQQRPNLFTTRVANIPPGEEIRVSIQYQQQVDRAGDIYSLRFPMTITPRYIPGTPVAAGAGPGWSPDTDAVPDASAITPPWGRQGENNHPTRITVNLDPGFELGEASSRYHRVAQQPGTAGETIFTLDERTHDANRDFLLQWQPAKTDSPQVAAFTETLDGGTYSLLMFTPPAVELTAPPPPREVVFVIDTSGSMGGDPLRQAKRSLLWSLDRLRPVDSFNIIEFNSGSRALFGGARRADRDTIMRGKGFVAGLKARGGTEMLGAMEKALCGHCDNGERLRQVIFLTDGAIGNEEQLFRLIQDRLGTTRLFTVGIGGAPNAWFMRKAAETGRGTYTYIGRVEESGEAMARLFATLETPMLTDIRVAPEEHGLAITPDPLPDLYGGKPLVLLAKGELPPRLTLSGHLNGEPWETSVSTASLVPRAGIAVLWGRQTIDRLMDLYRFSHGGEQKADLKRRITDLALAHHLVSPFTSLVAVDMTPATETGGPARDNTIANNSPTGTRFGLTATATPANGKLLAGALLALCALLLIRWQVRCEHRRAADQAATVRALAGSRP